MKEKKNKREKLDKLYDFNIFNRFHILTKIKKEIPFDIFLLINFYRKLINETHTFIFHLSILKDKLLKNVY